METKQTTEQAHTPGQLSVIVDDIHPKQARIESNFNTPGEWDDIYVSFSGYYGSYGPNLFASAPQLLEALKLLVDAAYNIGGEHVTGWADLEKAADAGHAAIAKATGSAA